MFVPPGPEYIDLPNGGVLSVYPNPGSPPAGFPRSDWTTAYFSAPGTSIQCYPAEHAQTAAKAASLEWSSIMDGSSSAKVPRMIPDDCFVLAVADRAMELNRYNWLLRRYLKQRLTLDEWLAESDVAIKTAYSDATAALPPTQTSHPGYKTVYAAVRGILDAGYHRQHDAYDEFEFSHRAPFDKKVLGRFAPRATSMRRVINPNLTEKELNAFLQKELDEGRMRLRPESSIRSPRSPPVAASQSAGNL